MNQFGKFEMAEIKKKISTEKVMRQRKKHTREEKLSECLLCDELPEINQLIFDSNHFDKSHSDKNASSLQKEISKINCKSNENDCQRTSFEKDDSEKTKKVKRKISKTTKKITQPTTFSRIQMVIIFVFFILCCFFAHDYFHSTKNNFQKLTDDLEGKYSAKLGFAFERIQKQDRYIKKLENQLSKHEVLYEKLIHSIKSLNDQVMNINDKVEDIETSVSNNTNVLKIQVYKNETLNREEFEKMNILILTMKTKVDRINFSQNIEQKDCKLNETSVLKSRINDLESNISSILGSVHSIKNKQIALSEAVKNGMKQESENLIPNNNQLDLMHHQYENMTQLIMNKAKTEIDTSLKINRADSLALPDFAWKASGGSIHGPHHSDTCSFGNPTIKLFGLPLYVDPSSPRLAISSNHNPGDCWHMEGSQGYLVIKLATEIKPSMISLEHLDKNIDRYSKYVYLMAPKDFEVYAWVDKSGQERVRLGSFTYLREGDAIQTFSLDRDILLESLLFVEFRVLSNWGNSDCTCIYRVRIHGVSNSWVDN